MLLAGVAAIGGCHGGVGQDGGAVWAPGIEAKDAACPMKRQGRMMRGGQGARSTETGDGILGDGCRAGVGISLMDAVAGIPVQMISHELHVLYLLVNIWQLIYYVVFG